MVTPASARLLELEEGDVTPTVVWTTTTKERTPRSAWCGIWLAALIALLMFLLGVCLGAFLNALTPDGAFPLGFLGSEELTASNSSEFIMRTANTSLADDLTELDSSLEKLAERWEDADEEEEEEEDHYEPNEMEKTEKEDEEEEEMAATEAENKNVGEEVSLGSSQDEEEETTIVPLEELEHELEDEEEEMERTPEDDDDEEEEVETTTAAPKPTKKGGKRKESKAKCPGFPWKKDRLPQDIRPLFYELNIHPNATTNELHGQVRIQLDVEIETDVIILHAERLSLEAFKLEVNEKPRDADHLECPPFSMWAFKLNRAIFPNNKVELELHFKGQVLSDLQGLYVSTHTDEKQVKARSMVTQFEPSYARKAFPCFDEPEFKAEFKLSVVREAKSVVRSNTNLKRSSERHDGLYLDEFNPTVKMSTYLVAFAVLDGYDYARRLAKKTIKPIEVRLYAPKDVLSGQSEFGLDTAVRALEFFEDYFNISYPLEKIDLLALDDFSEGAMENWGLVTFRDSALLYAPNSSALYREYIALVICHEMAHQWFGNLVTMAWWDDLWLNEGFANYMEYRCVDSLYPTWNIMTRFYVDNVANSQELDGMPSSRAIASAGEGQALINLFDAIAYNKAAAVIHMIHQLAGEKNFRNALIEYLNKFKFSNARGEELWKIVEKNAHLGKEVSIRGLADRFTTQVGYPVITVNKTKDGIVVAGNQNRFLYDANRQDTNSSWPLQIIFRVDGEEDPKTKWLKEDDDTVSVRQPKESNWVVANSGGIGYFKVQYDKKLYEALANQFELDHEALTAVDRTMILADAYDLARGARLNISTYLNLVQYADKETDRVVWLQLSRHLRIVENMIAETDFVNIFKDFERSILLPIYDKYAWNETAEPALRFELVQFACKLRIRDCTRKTFVAYNDWQKNKTRPSPELTGIVLEEGVRQGGPIAFERSLVSLLNESRTVTEKQHLLAAISATRSPELINRLLKLCTDKSGQIKPSVVPRVMNYIMVNELARPIGWRYFKMHFDQFVKILGQSSNLLISCIRAAAERMNSEEELLELQEFLKNRVAQSRAKLEQIFEQVRMNIQWRRLHEDNLRNWLEEWDVRRRVVQRARRF